MKSIIALFISFLVSLSVFGLPNNPIIQDHHKAVLTYQGTTDDNQYKFTDDKKKVILFDEVSFEGEIDLYDEDYIGKKLTITWEEESEEVLDDEGEPTGETTIIKIILEIEE